MGSTNDIKKGVVIRHQNNLYVVTDFNFVNPGKGAAFFKTKLKDIHIGKTIEITYKSGESLDVVEVFKQTMQYLYNDGDTYSFMNKETYETVEVNKDMLGEDSKYLKEGLAVIASINEGNIVTIQIPIKVTYEVAEAPPAVKGDTASGNVQKDIVLENGLEIKAPIFIKTGDNIVVNTEKGEYDSRVQK